MLEYCDKIAHEIKKSLDEVATAGDEIIGEVGKIEWDLHPTEGWLQSTSKQIVVKDKFGKSYSVSIQTINL
jgi:hypothetical protein